MIYMKGHNQFERLGKTRDDAAGEAFDKVARLMKLPYPGGPQIDRLALEGKPSYPLPRAWLESDSLDFSFSGLKSAVLNLVHNANQRKEEIHYADLAASFQDAVLDVLGCVFLGIKTMGWTLYSSFMLSFYSSMCEKLFPMSSL